MSQENEPTIDLELQTRIIAMVLGEASDFECEELERLIEQREDLAAFVKEITEVDDLMREVVALQANPAAPSGSAGNEPQADTFAELADWDASQWKLSSDRRQNVLAAIDTAPQGITAAMQSESSGDLQMADQETQPVWQNKRNLLRWISIAASVLALVSLSVFMLLPSYRRFAALAPADSRRYRSVTMTNDAQALFEDNAETAKAFLYDSEDAPAGAIDGALAEPHLYFKSSGEGAEGGAIVDALRDQRLPEQAETNGRYFDDSLSTGVDKFVEQERLSVQSFGTGITDLESKLLQLNRSTESESRSRNPASDRGQAVRDEWRRDRSEELFGEPSSGDGGQPMGQVTNERFGDQSIASKPGSNLSASTEGKVTLPTPDYLQDDVQYFPAGPDVKLAPSASSSVTRNAAPKVAQKIESMQQQSQQGQRGQAAGELSRPGAGVNGPGSGLVGPSLVDPGTDEAGNNQSGTNDMGGYETGGLSGESSGLGIIPQQGYRSVELSDEATVAPRVDVAAASKVKQKRDSDTALGDLDDDGDGIANRQWFSKSSSGKESSFGVNGATGGAWMDSGVQPSQPSQPNEEFRFGRPADGYAGSARFGGIGGFGRGGGIGGGDAAAPNPAPSDSPSVAAGFAPGNYGPMGGAGGIGANESAITGGAVGGGGFGGGGGGMGGGGSVELDSRVSDADLSLSLDALGAVAANQPITGTAVGGRVSGRRGESADATKALIVGGIMVDSNGNQAASSVRGGEIMDAKQLSDRGRLPAVVAGTPSASPEPASPVPASATPASAESSNPTAPTDLFAMGMGEVDGERSARERSRAAQQAAGVELRELQEALKSTEAIRGIVRQQESKLQSQIATSDKDQVAEQLMDQYKAPDAAAIVEFQTESLSGELDKLNGLIQSRESNIQRYRNGHWGGMAGRATATPQPAKPESASQGLQGGSRQRWDIRKEADDFAGEGQAGADVSRDFYSYAEGRDGGEASVLEGELADELMLGVPLERRLKMLGTDQSNGEANADGKPTNEYIRGKREGIPLGWRKADISFENNVDFDISFERDGQEIAGKDVAVTSRRSKSSKGLKKKAPAAPKQDAERAAGLNETSASEEPFSTFSLHVSDVAFKLARTALSQGQWPEADKVRIEEFVNALDYSDPNPSQDSKVACQLEQCVHPFLQQRNLMRVSMRTAASGRTMATPLSLTLVLDHSGSMERADRRQLLTEALGALAKQLKPTDKVTLISFARTPRLVAEQVAGNQTGQLLQQVIQQPIEGGTNLEAALELAYEKARESHRSGTFQSRIVLLTDGAVNLGDADPESLQKRVIQMRQSGIAFDAAGISANGLNDEVLETLTRKGDGRYYLIDGLDGSDDRFAQQVAGALRPAAKNVKVQVEFNPQRVGQYKLLGFEKHALKKEDFRNDKVDAAEMAAEEAGVAVYQFQVKPDGQGDIGSVSVRFQDLETGRMIEQRWPIPYQSHANEMEQAAPSMQLAAAAALFAAKLRGDGIGQTVDLKELYRTLQALPSSQRSAPRVAELIQMIQQAELIQ